MFLINLVSLDVFLHKIQTLLRIKTNCHRLRYVRLALQPDMVLSSIRIR